MLTSLPWQQRLTACCIALLCLLGSFVTNAQYTISPGSGTCITHTQGGTSPSYTFTASGIGTTPTWSVRGELFIVSQSTSPLSVTIRSTGYGKGRITLTYNQGPQCNGQSNAIDVYKSFVSPDAIVGPNCIRPSESATFSIKPIVSTASQILTEIGVDRYEWKINGVKLTALATIGWGVAYVSGDSSSITVIPPATLSGSPVISAAVGKCNFATPKTKTVTTKANVPVFSGTPPSCIPTNSTTPFTLSVINEAGVNYTWTANTNWTISTPTISGGLNTVTITPNGNAGEVSVVASTTAGCESSVNKLFISRQLTAGTNSITGGAGCLTVGTPVTYTLFNPPANSNFNWTAPAGWTPTTATGTSVTFTPTASAQPGSISVKTSTCASGISVTPVVSNNQGLAFSFTNLDCGLFRVNATGFIKTGATYQWYLNGVYQGATTGNNNSFTYDPWVGAQTISVTITKASPDCLNASASLANVTYGCAGGRISNAEKADASLQSGVEVFPNPAQNQVTLKLPNNEQVKEIALLDLTGKVHKRLNTLQTNYTFNVNELPSGTYALQVKVGNKLITKKVVLVK